MQTAADRHDQVADVIFPETDGVFEDATAFDAAEDVFDDDAPLRNLTVVCLLFVRELAAFRLLDGTGMLNTGEVVAKKAQIIEQLAVGWERVGRGIGNRLVVGAAFVRVAEKQHQKGLNEKDVLHCVALFLAAITTPLFIRVLGADDGTLGPVVDKKGVEASCVTCATRAWSSARVRAGRSPVSASACASTGSRVWIHWLAFGCPMPNSTPCAAWIGATFR